MRKLKKFYDGLSTKQLAVVLSIIVLFVGFASWHFQIEPSLHPNISTTYETKGEELPILQHEYIELSPKIRLYWEAKPSYNYKNEIEWKQELTVKMWDSGWGMWRYPSERQLDDLGIKGMKDQLAQIPGARIKDE